MHRAVFVGAVALALGTVPAFAQSVTLPAGFQPDPMIFNVMSGGTVDVSVRLPGCYGRISDNSSIVVDYQGGGQPLSFFGWSSADTTLVVYAADGQFYCDDDGMGAVVGTLDPLLTIANAPPGEYVVWVGTLEENGPAELGITTRGPYEIAAAFGIPPTMVRTDSLVATPAALRWP